MIEHIGTKIGHCTLMSDYKEMRKKYAKELLRVTKRKGRIIINCPNKRFPIDIAHAPTDAAGPTLALRSYIYRHTRLTIHRTWGAYHLLSYSEVQRLFSNNSAGREIEPLSLKDYFSFALLDHGFAGLFKAVVPLYVNYLPRYLLSSCLDPYVSVVIRK